MNVVFFAIVLTAFLAAGWSQLAWDPAGGGTAPMEALSTAMVDSAAGAVDLAIGLVGVMTLFLGLMKVAEAGGMLTFIARLIRPLMTRLFPDVPAEHPAMGAMILNLSANALGLGNAATPFGIRAMQELDRLNDRPGVATDSMVLFLAINTSSVTLLPTGVIALRAAAGSADPAAILPTTLFATLCSTAVAIIGARIYRRFFPLPPLTAAPPREAGPEAPVAVGDGAAEPLPEEAGQAYPVWISYLALATLVALIPVTVAYGEVISPWILPGLMLGFLAFGVARRVRIYEVFVEGAKEGFQVAVRIIPYLVAILVAVGMFRASGAMDALVSAIGGVTSGVGLPAEALPMALLRPLSGSGAYGIMAAIINDPAIGPDSYVGYLVSTLQGSTETTFYVLAVYFGAVQVRRLRHGLATALTADVAGIAGAVAACSYLFGGAG
ncbi:nucleoside recognition domain-containing protein [Thioalbus denitrificans]|uniref:Spore maturation protein SpmA n=1 Tax=Thioalbus denitrificans TaxID=547122 RepID=A0A369CLQ9_9GAMM|nr:nucleoside recognition domain-containing protein [Thioalbus denitrificans]RCX33367.1 spore maturation protein SpmA [Thioalbus denitrificans]